MDETIQDKYCDLTIIFIMSISTMLFTQLLIPEKTYKYALAIEIIIMIIIIITYLKKHR